MDTLEYQIYGILMKFFWGYNGIEMDNMVNQWDIISIAYKW